MHRDHAGSRLAKSFYYSYKLGLTHFIVYYIKRTLCNFIIKSNLSSPSTADVPHVTISVTMFNLSSPNTADVPHGTISVTMFPMLSLLLVGTVLYLVMFSVSALSGSGWLRSRGKVTEPLAWLMARDWTASAVKSATCTPSTSTVYRSVG